MSLTLHILIPKPSQALSGEARDHVLTQTSPFDLFDIITNKQANQDKISESNIYCKMGN